MRNPFARRHPECPDCGERHRPPTPEEQRARTAIVNEAVALVTAFPPGAFPRLQAAIMRAVELDERTNGPLPRGGEVPAQTPEPVDPIDAEVAKFVAEMDKYPTAEEPER